MLLTGVRVLDLSRLLPGGFCTRVLADAGAEVLKVEPPGGDPLRQMPGGEAFFEALHHGKRLITLDWMSQAGRERLWEEVRKAEVLVEGFRPGVMERAGLGYSALAAGNPLLIYCAITGYGSTGPLAARAGHDLNYLARSGGLSVMPRSADGTPMIPGIQVADHAGGLHAAFLIAAALHARGQTGQGSRLEVSMTDVVRGWTDLPRAAARARIAGPPLTGTAPCYHVYPVSDGFLSVAAIEPKFWRSFCHAIGRDDLAARQFDPLAIPEVEGLLAGRTRAAWMAAFEGRDVCVEPCIELGEDLT
ncbi:MAG TPA: CoA transferase [Candidatus Dormibacteraeota bacterium]|jgi:crotonobetainyl-CoA:carnitine CoA-transferase CaiB-like acyl-CoA transferase